MLRNRFKKTYIQEEAEQTGNEDPNIPQGLWRKCNKCRNPILVEDVISNYYICPKCEGYFRMHAYRRVEMIVDEGSFEEWNADMPFSNPLNFPGYEKKVDVIKEKTNLNESIITGKGSIENQEVAIGVCDARFLMGSMGRIVGEKITQMVEKATADKMPVIIYACSGGARMQEGIVSLMQMAKTSAALQKHHEAGELFISVLTDPTTGGVTASFAMLGDIIIAEPGALIGFAGPRVISQTIGQKLPENFQKAEFLLEHGFIDKIVPRSEQKEVLGQILRMHAQKKKANNEALCKGDNSLRKQRVAATKTPWEIVQLSRDAQRPTAKDYINVLFDEFIEFHGDRYFGDDGAIVGGIANFHGETVTVIAQQKGKTTKENIKRNFGMPSPEGYRKALRFMKQAEKFNRPIICFVDTPGAFCGMEAEERGQGEAIARNLFEMANLTVPVVSIVIGEGGSGGALAMAVANEVWMLENAIYSILSPEGFATILWKDSKKASTAAKHMKITAEDLYEMKLIEEIISEKEPASLITIKEISKQIEKKLSGFLQKYHGMTKEDIQSQRYERFRRM